MILVALGANLPSAAGDAAATLHAAMARLDQAPVRIIARSRLFESPPWPPSDQPWYVNAIVRIETVLDAAALLAHLHGIERDFGRVRGVVNAARPLDLDLIDYDGQVRSAPLPAPELPHPRMQDRAFVLLPLADVAPDWRHPVTQAWLAGLIAALPHDTVCRPISG